MIPILSLSPNLITLRRICQGFALELSSLHPELISSPQTVRANAERERPHFYLVRQCHQPPTIIVTMIIIISCLFTTHRSRTRIKVTRKVLSFRIVWPLRKLYHRVRKWLELQRFFFVYHKYHQILKLTTKHQKISGILQRSGHGIYCPCRIK